MLTMGGSGAWLAIAEAGERHRLPMSADDRGVREPRNRGGSCDSRAPNVGGTASSQDLPVLRPDNRERRAVFPGPGTPATTPSPARAEGRHAAYPSLATIVSAASNETKRRGLANWSSEFPPVTWTLGGDTWRSGWSTP